MELSSKVRYALLALLELASKHERGDFLQIDQMVAAQQIPDRYLAQLLMRLRRCGIIRSQRGARGGYLLARAPQQIALMEILVCLEGRLPSQYEQAESQTIENIVVEEVWQEATEAAMAVLESYTLQTLCDKRKDRQQLNPMYYI